MWTRSAWLMSRTAKEGDLREFDYEPKPFEEDDVDIAIMYTGVCGSDLSTMSSGWSDVDYPQVSRVRCLLEPCARESCRDVSLNGMPSRDLIGRWLATRSLARSCAWARA